jgi:hypothetical protein
LISCKQSKRKIEKTNATFSFFFKDGNAKEKFRTTLKPRLLDYISKTEAKAIQKPK